MSTEEPMSIEDRVRTATRAGATLVRDIGPLAAPEPTRLRRRPAQAARRWGSWGIPLAAAAAVVLVAVSLVAVRQFGASAPATGGPATNAPATVPRYYVDLDASDVSYTGLGPLITGDDALIVGDDVTGKAIATVKPPSGLHFDSVQGASDDRTFVVMASRPVASIAAAADSPGPDTFYLLRIAPGTAHPYQLTNLPIKLPGSSVDVLAYALSPNDRELAVESQNRVGGSALRLGIYSVSSRAELRAWTTNKQSQSPGFQPTLSWLSDGTQLAFSNMPSGGGAQVDQLRTIDVTGPGTDLLAASHVVFTITNRPPNSSTCWVMNLTPDGGTATCATQYGYTAGSPSSASCSNGGLEVTAYSARTGRPVRVLYKFRDACSDGLAAVLWTDSSARSIIGATETNLPGTTNIPHAGQLGVITDGHFRALKLPKTVSLKDYLMMAF